MKLRPYALAGFLFLGVFLLAIVVGMAIGKWNPAGIGETGTEELGEEHEETTTLPELHGYMNLLEYLKENGISPECVAQKLGVAESELNIEARTIAEKLGLETYQLPEKYKDCLPAQEKDGEEKDEGRGIPEFKGYMNFLDWLENNGYSTDCVASKLGIPMMQLDAEGKQIADMLKVTPEDLPKMVQDCRGLPPKDQQPAPGDNGSQPSGQLPSIGNASNMPGYYKSNGIVDQLKTNKSNTQKAIDDLKKKTEEKRKAVEDLLKTFEDKAKNIDKKR
ncbi:MAG TPA: hypothetical protein PLX04_08360 [Caldisericia bacterium]|nr:hypothetical protein [Caldisericia bacterium]HOU07766.1 hypothetical protein [Caldisericia bacterium]HPL90249.1 hypothetical protein [Caldisericia bacterium]HQG59336.1 hypothetical protein [Caldisericia bacterium]HQH48432.1 hypothetical protein [Caldisericia bacterium]